MHELSTNYEQLHTAPEIYVERLNHPLTQAEVNAIQRRMLLGDKTAHYWGPEAVRMRTRNPLFLSIDSIPPLLPWEINFDRKTKTNLWLHLPAAPGDINDKGIIHFLGADINFRDISPFIYNLKASVQELKNVNSVLKRNDDNDPFVNPNINAFGQGVEVGIEDLTLALPILFFTKSLLERILAERMTRRVLLQKTPMILGAIASSTVFGALDYLRYEYTDGGIIGLARTEQEAQQLQKVAAIMRPRIERSVDIDGRTALLFVKLKEYMQGKDGVGVETVGYTHDPDILGSDETNGELIHAHVQELTTIQDEILDSQRVKLNSAEKITFRQRLIQYVAKTDEFIAIDPGGPVINPNLADTIDKIVGYNGTFQSKLVIAATRDLISI